jgi:hypothetical protein
MSYARFSSESDIYVYADVYDGITCHIASSRPIYDPPLPPHPANFYDPSKTPEEFTEELKAYGKLLVSAQVEYLKIDLPYAGNVCNMPADEMAEFLKELKDLGYKVPDGTIERLIEDNQP